MQAFLAVLLVLIPGACWWIWFGNRDQDGIEILARVFGISIAFQALIALFFFLLNLSLSVIGLGIIYVTLLGLAIWGYRRGRNIKPDLSWSVALVIIAVLLGWRFFQSSTLVLPAWVDSLHHVLIVRKIIETGLLPGDLAPYLRGPFYYHYTFHVSAAVFGVLSRLNPAQSVLVWGQIINAGIGLSVYSLGKVVFKNWKTALLALFLATFVTKMPAYYLSWGRYTLLTGLFFLTLAVAGALRYLQGDQQDGSAVLLLTAGTLLSHYFAAVILAVCLVSLGIWHILRGIKDKIIAWQPLLQLTLYGLCGLALASPWLVRVFQNTRMTLWPEWELPQQAAGYFLNTDQWQYLWNVVGPVSGHILLGLAIPGLVLGFINRNTRAFATWSLFLLLMALPWGLKLGGFRFDHFAISLFIPISLFGAFFLCWVITRLENQSFRGVKLSLIASCLIAGLILSGGIETKDVLNTGTVFTDQSDLAALQWIDEHITENARFFINTIPWGKNLYRGVDGGAWVLPYTGRWTIVPTIFYPFGGDKEYNQQIREFGNQAQTVSACGSEFWNLVDEADLTHLYLKEGTGSLRAAALKGCERLKQLYSNAGVSIWLIGSDEENSN